MSLVIETQFAALTVEPNGEFSRNDEENNSLGVGAAGGAGADSSSRETPPTAISMSSLGDSLPMMTSTGGGRKSGDRKWIRSCKFANIRGVQPFRFRIMVNTKLVNLKRAYLRMTGFNGAVFMFNGQEVDDFDTPEDLGMEDGFQLEIL